MPSIDIVRRSIRHRQRGWRGCTRSGAPSTIFPGIRCYCKGVYLHVHGWTVLHTFRRHKCALLRSFYFFVAEDAPESVFFRDTWSISADLSPASTARDICGLQTVRSQLHVARIRMSTCAGRAFGHAGLYIWNHLPNYLECSTHSLLDAVSNTVTSLSTSTPTTCEIIYS